MVAKCNFDDESKIQKTTYSILEINDTDYTRISEPYHYVAIEKVY